eukprot:UN32319
MFYWPLGTTDYPYQYSKKEGVHIVLMSQNKENEQMFKRTLRHIEEAASYAEWDVILLVAAEENSNFIQNNWDFPLLPMFREENPYFEDVIISTHSPIHYNDIEDGHQRQCLGANLNHAIKTLLIQKKKM